MLPASLAVQRPQAGALQGTVADAVRRGVFWSKAMRRTDPPKPAAAPASP